MLIILLCCVTWQERTETELRTSMKSQTQELSDLQSKLMMKATQNQQLNEDNTLLTKLINKLKTVSFVVYTLSMTTSN